MLAGVAMGVGLVTDVEEELPMTVAGEIAEVEAEVEARLDEVMIGDDLHDRCGECEEMG